MFAKYLQQNPRFQAIGRQLPAYIMLLLVIYEIGPNSFTHYPYGLPAVIALIIVSLSQYFFRQLLFSLFIGTVSYIIFLQMTI